MTSQMERLESGLEAWGRLLCRRPWIAILAMLGCTAVLVSWLPQMKVAASNESMLHPDDEQVVRYYEFRKRYGREDRVVVAIQPPDLFAPDFLEKLRTLHEDLERSVPYIEEITSLVNVRSTHGDRDALIVEPLLEDWPESAAELRALEERVRTNPLYRNNIVSDDLRMTTIVLKPNTYSSEGGGALLEGFEDEGAAPAQFLTDGEARALVAALDEVVARYDAPDFRIFVAGPLILTDYFHTTIWGDTQKFFVLAIAAIAILLLVLFRRVSGVVLPLGIVVLSVLSTLGIMVLLGVPLSITVQVLPAFLLTIGVCDSVHVLVIVYQRLAAGSGKKDAIAFALRHTGVPVAMTSLTTCAGMLSFVPAALAPVSHLGVMAAVGVLLALVYSLVLLPALLAVLPIERAAGAPGRSLGNVLARGLVRVGMFATEHPWRVLGATALVVAVSAGGIVQLRFSHDWIKFLPTDDPIRISLEELDEAMKGGVSFEVLVDTGAENGLYDPDVLRRMESAVESVESYRKGPLVVGKTLSILDILKETHQALNENRPSHYALPERRDVIAQELLLFENSGSDDLLPYVDSQFRTARLSMRVPNTSSTLFNDYIAEVDARFDRILGEGAEASIVGMLPLGARVFTGLVTTMSRSYVIAFLLITPLMVLILRSVRRGLLSMIPNLLPIVFVLGFMGWFDSPLDASSVLVGAIVLGLAVDDTIHFMHKFDRYLAQTGSAAEAVRATLSTTGTAMLFTSLVLFAGFFVFTFAYVRNTAHFGMLAAIATLVAFLADILVAPALMTLETRRRTSVAAAEARAAS